MLGETASGFARTARSRDGLAKFGTDVAAVYEDRNDLIVRVRRHAFRRRIVTDRDRKFVSGREGRTGPRIPAAFGTAMERARLTVSFARTRSERREGAVGYNHS
jgi:hypothetical protein